MTAEKMHVAECKTIKSIVTKVLVLVSAILFKSIIDIGIGSTFCQSIVVGIDNSFYKYCYGITFVI